MKNYLNNYEKTLHSLREMIDFDSSFDSPLAKLDEAIRDSIIKKFEYTFELAWKTVKDYLEYLGMTEKIGSPREIIQLGFKQGIISDGEAWISMMLSRNALSHLYDEKASRDIYKKIKNEYVKLFNELKEKLDQAIEEERYENAAVYRDEIKKRGN